jgi:RNA polymerase sigma-70 factor (sigma-E family)
MQVTDNPEARTMTPLPLAVVPDPEGPGYGGFDEMFAAERVPMTRLAYLLVGSEAVAEEVVQDAFAQVYERWDRLDRPGGYLRTCVVHGARRAGKRRSRELRVIHESPEPAVLDARELLDALARLRPAWRAVVVLRFYGDMTQDEIADVLDMRVGTVKSTLHRALGQLREEIAR